MGGVRNLIIDIKFKMSEILTVGLDIEDLGGYVDDTSLIIPFSEYEDIMEELEFMEVDDMVKLKHQLEEDHEELHRQKIELYEV